MIDLLPRPRSLVPGEGEHRLPRDGVLAVRSDPRAQVFAARHLRRALDRATGGLPAARLAACERAFLTSLRHELAFWDAEEPDPWGEALG